MIIMISAKGGFASDEKNEITPINNSSLNLCNRFKIRVIKSGTFGDAQKFSLQWQLTYTNIVTEYD